MVRRFIVVVLLAVVVISGAACGNKKVKNPLAQVDSKQPDKVLYDRAIEAMKKGKYDVARLSLQTLINTYPDSEYVARAKLTIADSWYAEGGTAALAQAENEYKDFITFFPNMPEAAEAQMKVGDIHFKQMEKPDRDYTHAKRAEDEYRQMLLQFPDSPLAPQAKAKLLQVQEVLAEREFRIGRFYFIRGSYAASAARLQSLTDAYPLYSGADEALFLTGQAWEQQLTYLRNSRLQDNVKNRLIRDYTDHAAAAYSKIITRYPVTDRAPDAKARLAALDRPVPTPTAEAIAQNKAEEESRGKQGKIDKAMLNFKKRPDLSTATKVGEPTLVDPPQYSAPTMIRQANEIAAGKTGDNKVSVETTTKDDGSVPASQAVPRSDSDGSQAAPEGVGELKVNPDAASAPNTSGAATSGTTGSDPAAATTDNGNPAPKPAPPQLNEAAADGSKPAADANSQTAPADPKNTSTSKKKQKKGLQKLNPF